MSNPFVKENHDKNSKLLEKKQLYEEKEIQNCLGLGMCLWKIYVMY